MSKLDNKKFRDMTASYKGAISDVAYAQSETSFYFPITSKMYLSGTQLLLKNHNLGDSVTFQIVFVHPTEGEQLVNEFSLNWFVDPDRCGQEILIPENYPAEIDPNAAPDLKIKIIYKSTGVNDVLFYVNLITDIQA
ncbi:MAG: hypothetical protein OEL89_00360 [Candidatus Peregrinibacteria bacterium]|nr:hypothetical protein [Candidatus Peregrinibacteria bacterium]